MTIIDSILAKIGLMRVEDRIAETNRLRVQLEDSQQVIVDLNEMIYELRPDAEKFRAKAARDAEQKKAKRAAAKKVAG